MISSTTSTHLKLLGMAALWGASWPWGRVVAQAMPPLAAATLRFVLASIVLLCWMHRSGRLQSLRKLTARQWVGIALAAFVGVLGYAAFFMLGLQYVSASKGAIFITLNPAVTMLLAWLLFREQLNPIILAGMAMAVTGAMIVIVGGESSQPLAGGIGLGELLLLGCVACWVMYTLLGRVVLTGLDALTTTTMTAVIGAAMLFATSMAAEGPAAWATLPSVPFKAWACLLALAVGATALAYAWYFEGIKQLGASAAAGYIPLVPVFGVLVAGVWLGEPMGGSLLIGGLIAIAGTAAMNLGRMRKR